MFSSIFISTAFLLSTIGDLKRRPSMLAIPASDPAEWFDPESYPIEAIRAQRQGRVVVVLGIDSGGVVVTCRVQISSGTKALDEGTCALALERGRFNPATNAKGEPIASEFVLPVNWVIPNNSWRYEAAELPMHRSMTTEIAVNTEGIVATCKVTEQVPAEPGYNPCDDRTPGTRANTVTRNGRPVSYRLVQRTTTDMIIVE